MRLLRVLFALLLRDFKVLDCERNRITFAQTFE